MNDNRLLAVAAGVVFYSLLAIFPAIAAFVSLYGLIADASTIDSHLSLAAGIFPAGAVDILHEQIARLTAKGDAKLSLGFITGLVVALWSANAGMKAIIDALNVVYDEKEKRLRQTEPSFPSVYVRRDPVAHDRPRRGGDRPDHLFGHRSFVVLQPGYRRSAVAFGVGAGGGRYLGRDLSLWGQAAPGSALAMVFGQGSAAAAIGWLITSALFSWYIAHFGAYNATYGSLGAAVGMMMWMWISAIVILLGGELNAEIEHQTAHDSTVGAEKPLGERGAVMADTIGAARSWWATSGARKNPAEAGLRSAAITEPNKARPRNSRVSYFRNPPPTTPANWP